MRKIASVVTERRSRPKVEKILAGAARTLVSLRWWKFMQMSLARRTGIFAGLIIVRSVALAKPRFTLADMHRARPVTVLAADRQFAKRGITEKLVAIAC